MLTAILLTLFIHPAIAEPSVSAQAPAKKVAKKKLMKAAIAGALPLPNTGPPNGALASPTLGAPSSIAPANTRTAVVGHQAPQPLATGGAPPMVAPQSSTPPYTYAPASGNGNSNSAANPMGALPGMPGGGTGGAGGGPGNNARPYNAYSQPSNDNPYSRPNSRTADISQDGAGGYTPRMSTGNFQGDQLTCESGGENKCPDARLEFGPIPDTGFSSSTGGHQAFVKWMTPVALYVQARTGFPASVMIAQAGVESGWGTSNRFRYGNAIFGHSCFHGNTQTGSTQLGDKSFPWTGLCNAPRPEGGKYLSFHTREESVLAYVSLLLQTGPYPNVRRDVASAQANGDPGVASGTKVAADLAARGYAAGDGYFSQLSSAIRTYNLSALEKGSCQSCVYLSKRSGSRNGKQTVGVAN